MHSAISMNKTGILDNALTDFSEVSFNFPVVPVIYSEYLLIALYECRDTLAFPMKTAGHYC